MVRIARILHAGFIFESSGTRLLFDPILQSPFSRNCFAFPDLVFDHAEIRRQKFSAIFISHFHEDHCCFESLNFIHRDTPIYMYCIFPQMLELLHELGFKSVTLLNLERPVIIGPFEVTPLRALDQDTDSIFHLRVEGLNILNVVDSWIPPSTMAMLVDIKQWDLVLWPFQTMRELEVLTPIAAAPSDRMIPPESLEQLKVLRPRFLIPSSCQFQHESWSWYNRALFPISYTGFSEQVHAVLPHTEVMRLEPAKSFELSLHGIRKSDDISWIRAFSSTLEDYEYEPLAIVPSTAEIATNFAALTAEEEDFVIRYCQEGLALRFTELETSMEIYFQKKRHWKLSLYNHKGHAVDFSYLVLKNQLKISLNLHLELGWHTELPISKLYSALKEGESLTSMYMRINNVKFSAAVESEIREVDVLEDPLVRCLFNGNFASYQKAQLTKIKSKNR